MCRAESPHPAQNADDQARVVGDHFRERLRAAVWNLEKLRPSVLGHAVGEGPGLATDEEIAPAEAVRAYHGELSKDGSAPKRTIEDDLETTEAVLR
jgi:hypothetical protein